MLVPDEFYEKLKWAIYDFIGAISVMELAKNVSLQQQIERLSRRLSLVKA